MFFITEASVKIISWSLLEGELIPAVQSRTFVSYKVIYKTTILGQSILVKIEAHVSRLDGIQLSTMLDLRLAKLSVF